MSYGGAASTCNLISTVGVSVKTFYGVNLQGPLINKKTSEEKCKKKLPLRLDNLLGPTQIWCIFNKQNDALEFACRKRSGLMTFAFQQWDGRRLFLVAHPKIFWHYDVQKRASERCSYEIIPESCACKLYFDLEFDIEFNPKKEGKLVVDTFISVVLQFLCALFSLKVVRENILNLDSSTDKKFSRHLIFLIDSHVFSDNKSVGAFVHFICQKLKLYLGFTDDRGEHCNQEKLHSSDECRCCLWSQQVINCGFCVKEVGLSQETLQNLIVLDRKGKTGLICDESVYSRNRHFRLYQNTKWGKNTPLVLSDDNVYVPRLSKSAQTNETIAEAIFLNSLVSNIDFDSDDNQDHKSVLHFQCEKDVEPASTSARENYDGVPQMEESIKFTQHSPYPEVDKFISSVVSPGHIWRSAFFGSSSTIVYDIVGNRFCQNIGRYHRSNNIKYIVNLNNYTYYQKCHDPDCSYFRSCPVVLPPELKFKLEDVLDLNDAIGDNYNDNYKSFSDSELSQIAGVLEDLYASNSEMSS